ncbi:MAG TPA: two-component regulator propeller domain-containing protein [Acidobacteriota bacterium]|nr:two-component regulator propeller domain-containing protein [Acidobacteriota bacterium]
MTRRLSCRTVATCRAVAVCVLILCPASTGSAQLRTWENFTNVRNVIALATHGDTVWAATTGGLVRRSTVDPSVDARLTNADGLGGNDLQFVCVDSAGALWTGGANGRLSRRRSDTRWDVYPFADGDGLPITLNAATPGPDRFLWVGSHIGVHKFDTQRNGGELKETYQRIGEWPDGMPVTDVLVAEGMLWITSADGVARARVDDPFLLIRDHWMSWGNLGTVDAIAVFDGAVYAGGANGLFVFAPAGISASDSAWLPVGLTDRHVVDLIPTNDTLWVMTSAGLAVCVDGLCATLSIPDAGTSGFTSVARSDDGTIWVGKKGLGVWSRLDDEWRRIEFLGPLDDLLADVAVGTDGKVWCVFPNHGAAFLEDGQWTKIPYYIVGSGGPGEDVAVAPNGDVWLGTFGSGAYRVDPAAPLDDTGWVHYNETNSTLVGIEQSASYVLVTDIAFDSTGRVWLANSAAVQGRAIAFYDHGCWGIFDTADGLQMPGLRAVLAMTANSLLIGTEGGGLLELTYPGTLCDGSEPIPTQGHVKQKGTGDGLPSDEVTALLIDRADSLWVGTKFGLVKWDPRFREFDAVDLPAEAGLTIQALAADAANGIWIGTTLGLVYRAPDGTMEFFTSAHSGLVGDNVQAIAVDEAGGALWIATRSGLSRTHGPLPAASAIENAVAYPNPVTIGGGEEPLVRFNAPIGSHVFIFTVDGKAVRDLPAHLGWDCRNNRGRFVANGIYLFVLRGPDAEYGRGKIAVFNRE